MAKNMRLRLPPDQTGPLRARRAVAHAEPGGIAGPSSDRVQLVLSELVTNALEHARFLDEDQVSVSVRWSRTLVRIEVEDPGPCFEWVAVSEPELSEPGGWGLFLVGKMCDRWGVVRREGRCVVWAEFDLDQRAVHGHLEAASA